MLNLQKSFKTIIHNSTECIQMQVHRACAQVGKKSGYTCKPLYSLYNDEMNTLKHSLYS